jgi:hypothetical protein
MYPSSSSRQPLPVALSLDRIQILAIQQTMINHDLVKIECDYLGTFLEAPKGYAFETVLHLRGDFYPILDDNFQEGEQLRLSSNND